MFITGCYNGILCCDKYLSFNSGSATMAVIACANYSTQNLILSIVELTFKEINVILCYKNVPILVDILFCKLKFPSPTVFTVFSHMFFAFLVCWSFFGHLVFYFFSPLDSVYGPSSMVQ